MDNSHKNADRFSGFAGVYHAARPACPEYVVNILTRYFGGRPQTVVDLGCGTGLSSFMVCNTDVELAQKAWLDQVDLIELEREGYKDAFHRYPKERHLADIQNAGYLRNAPREKVKPVKPAPLK